MEETHGDKLLEEVKGHIARCSEIGMAAVAEGQTFVAGQAFTAVALAQRVAEVLAGSAPPRNVERLPFDKPPTEKKPRAPRKPKAGPVQGTLADAGAPQRPDTNGSTHREAE